MCNICETTSFPAKRSRSNMAAWAITAHSLPRSTLPRFSLTETPSAPHAPHEATMTHEMYIHAVRAIVAERLNADEQTKVRMIKLVYGAGSTQLRGVTYYGRWSNGSPEAEPFVEVCSFGQSSLFQLACTTIHELGHVITPIGEGHGRAWKASCSRLGLTTALAAGQEYAPEHLDPDVLAKIQALPTPDDGAPYVGFFQGLGLTITGPKPKPCGMGVGAKGGKSRGKGSGSRMIKVVCLECDYSVRMSRKWLDDENYGAPACPMHHETMHED